jgi:2-octaprenyl-6-methoxyphenol hydroxylase
MMDVSGKAQAHMRQDDGARRRAPASGTVIVAGGGLAGAAFAIALKSALGREVEIVMHDPALARDPSGDGRASAIAAAGRRMLETLGVWQLIDTPVQPIRDMIVTDSRLGDVVRPVFLTFADPVAARHADDAGTEDDPGARAGEPFAHMVENAGLLRALRQRAAEMGIVMRPDGVRRVERDGARLVVRDDKGGTAKADLVVAADGARSRLREAAGLGWVGWRYGQSGIVATIAHERDHEGRAVEHFLPAGPFAILPLAPATIPEPGFPHRSSIVWTERSDAVADLLALDEEDLAPEIERRFGLELGAIRVVTRPQAYPLSFGIARSFHRDGLVLLGDAAHVVHPIAGQGLNLGLKDAAVLAEYLAQDARLGLRLGEGDALDRYERNRRRDTIAMGFVTDGLNRLFSNDFTPLRLVRDLGLGLVDRMPGLKRFFIGEAAGVRPGTPRLMRGEPL